MKREQINKRLLILSGIATIMMAAVMPKAALAINASYLFSLANYEGVIPFNWERICVDDGAGEVYVVDSAAQSMKVFNHMGMETYEFQLGDLGSIRDFATDHEGNFIFLSSETPESPVTLVKCNYRGEIISKVDLKGFPPELSSGFSPDTLVYRNNRIYLASRPQMRVVVTDVNGVFQKSYDLASMIKMDEKARMGSTGIFGLTVNDEGTILFTIPSSFSVFAVSPDGAVRSFGARGGAPGKFNIVSGIAADDRGNIYVTDRLKSVVMIFDRNFEFKVEFGYRGSNADNLIVPNDLAVDKKGRLYVSQLRKRGVSVFTINFD